MQEGHAENRLRWGVLGTANIAIKAVIPAIQASGNGVLVAVASREQEKARRVADQFGVSAAYGSYEALLEAADVDAVYIPLPNHLHAPWTERAAMAGKHVLCEKPLALNAEQATEMVAACERYGVALMEAFMYRFHPRIREAQRLADEGAIGQLRLARAAFSFQLARRPNIRLDPSMGGGALMDVGCYGVNFARHAFGIEPAEVFAYSEVGRESGVDEALAGLLRFPSGAIALIDCSFQAVRRLSAEVVGDAGRLEIPDTWLPGANESSLVVETVSGRTETRRIPGVDQYRIMVEEFADAALAGRPVPLPASDAVANMRVIDGLYRSAREGRAVRLA